MAKKGNESKGYEFVGTSVSLKTNGFRLPDSEFNLSNSLLMGKDRTYRSDMNSYTGISATLTYTPSRSAPGKNVLDARVSVHALRTVVVAKASSELSGYDALEVAVQRAESQLYKKQEIRTVEPRRKARTYDHKLHRHD